MIKEGNLYISTPSFYPFDIFLYKQNFSFNLHLINHCTPDVFKSQHTRKLPAIPPIISAFKFIIELKKTREGRRRVTETSYRPHQNKKIQKTNDDTYVNRLWGVDVDKWERREPPTPPTRFSEGRVLSKTRALLLDSGMKFVFRRN